MSMHLFRLENTNRVQWWVVAPDEDAAIDWSLAHGRVKARKNVKKLMDQTDYYLAQPMVIQGNLRDLLAHGTEIGQASMLLRNPEERRYRNEWKVWAG